MGFLRCFLYLAVTGIFSFVLGRILPKDWFKSEAFPYRDYRFEKKGKIYNKIHVKKWQDRIPDMSRILPRTMPAKRLSAGYKEKLPRMIQETCVAEMIHFLLCLNGLACIFIWKGPGGVVLSIVYILGNLPFIVVQRYNRPRLLQLMKKCGDTKEKTIEHG